MAKSIADRIDCGMICLEPTKADLKALEPIMAQRFDEEPNIVFHVYKNRRGKYVRVKVWAYADLGTCRTRDMFMTDNDYKLIPVDMTKIVTHACKDITSEIKETQQSEKTNIKINTETGLVAETETPKHIF